MNKHCIYNNKYKRELFYSQKAQESRLRTLEANENEIINNQIPLTKKIKYYLKKYKYPIIIGGVIILVGIIIAIIITNLPKKIKNYENIALKSIFSPAFKINTKEDTLTQFSFKSSQSYESITKDGSSPYIIFTNAIYELYTLNSSLPPKEEEEYYKIKYTTTIAINSFCNKLSLKSDDNDCELKPIFDLNKREKQNLRRNEENEDLLEKAILPICIVEHTDTNVIISLTCPETFSISFKNDIIQAFQNIKPNSTKAIISGNNEINITDIQGNDEVNIDILNNECSELNETNSKSMKCNSAKNIITDKEGNLLSITKTISKNINYNEKNKFLQNSTYDFHNIPEQNSTSFNPKIYKTNLDIFFSKTSSLMKKEVLINNFTEYFLNLTQKLELKEEENNLRYLEDQQIPVNKGVHQENIFFKTVFDIPIELNIKNDLGLGVGESAKVYSFYNINNEFNQQLSFKQIQTQLNKTLEEFISVTKSGNKLAYLLNKELNEPLLKLKDVINEKIEKINLFLPNQDLSELFDSTLALKEIDSLPYEFIPTIKNLSDTMDELGNNIYKIINSTMIKLHHNIYDFLDSSHNLIFQIFNNLTTITDVLYSNKSKIVGISSYYLNNNKNTSYYESIEILKELLDNYYKKEAETIRPLVNNVFIKFYEKTFDFVQRLNYKLDNITERLTKDNLVIISSQPGEKNDILNYIKNIKNKIKEILNDIENKFKENVNLKENGYFETQEEIVKNLESYDKITSRAFNISYILDHNELVDPTFDNVMINFKNNFLFLLKYIENSLKEKFPLEENVLVISLFDNIYLKKIDQSFKSEKGNIVIFIKNENDKYLESMENIFNSFIKYNGTNFDQIKTQILNDFSELTLFNLNKTYNDSLTLVFKSINEIIEYNKDLSTQYLNNVKNANSHHITKGFIDKYNTYINNIQTISNFINNNLKNNLENKYNNVLNQLNSIFKSIQTTNENIFQKYYKQITSYADNYSIFVQILFERFNKYITKEIYNQKFLPLINNFISSATNNLNNIKSSLENIYNNIAKKSQSTSTYDYDIEHVSGGDRYCCDHFLGFCIDHCRTPVVYNYEGKNVAGTNNHLNLKKIQFSDYVKNFDDKYGDLYTKLFNGISSYNTYLPYLVSKIKSNNEKILKEDGSNYMNTIQQNVNKIIQEKLSKNLLVASYDYFEKEITNVLPNALNSILEQWKEMFDDIYKNLTNNKPYLKSSISEFYKIASTYFELNNKNIFNNFISSVSEKLKNEFNYTNKYYYDLIYSKVNKSCSYVLDNIPLNEAPLDEIINIRLEEINTACNNMMNQIKNTRVDCLTKNKQEEVLNITTNNFFNIDNIVNEQFNNFTNQLKQKVDKIDTIIEELKKESNDPEELIIAKFYLENYINKGHINEIYDEINRSTFIDLQNNAYHNMITSIWKNDKEKLTKSLKIFINELNKNQTNEFIKEFETYNNTIRNKIYKEFYTKDNLEKKINSIFTNGLNNANEDSKKKIYDILDSILNKIKSHITNEAKRLTNEMTSYSNNYDYIKNRIDNYKDSIYEQFYAVLTTKIDGFLSLIMEKFYKNHLEKGFEEFKSYFKNEDFGKAQFLNISINLNEILIKEINTFLAEYKNIALGQIEFLNEKAQYNLDELFSFSNMKSKINNEINNYYNTILLPILKREAIYTYEDDHVSHYDFSSAIINDIDTFITKEIKKAKEIMKIMEGKQYELNETFSYDFSNVKKDIVNDIKNKFGNFISNQLKKEDAKFNKNLGEIIADNFDSILVDFVSTFSVDFYDRILKFNEIQKINILYEQLKYSLYQTMTYYINLSESNNNPNLPLNLKEGILTLNNIESIIQINNAEILSKLNSQLTSNFEEEKNYMIQSYIKDINTDPIFESEFSKKVMDKLKEKLNENTKDIEEKFVDSMEKNIRNSFINGYKNILNKAAEDLIKNIKDYKNQLIQKLSNSFLFDSDSVLDYINKTFNNMKSLNEEFESSLDKYKVDDDITNFFEITLSDEIIISKYKDLNDFLNKKSAKFVINSIDFYSNKYKDNYSIKKFEDLINNANSNFTSYINTYTTIINNYGGTKEIYESNLQKEIDNEEEKPYDTIFDISLNDLINSSFIIKQFIKNLGIFTEFEEKISNNIKEKNNQYEYTKYILDLDKANNSNYNYLMDRLNNLNNISLEYYLKANNTYSTMKEQIINNIIKMDEFINFCKNITNEVINKNFLKIKNKYESIKLNETITNDIITIPEYNYNDPDSDNVFGFSADIQNYIVNIEFFFDIIFDESNKTPKVIGNLINNILPKSFIIDACSSNGPMGKIGRKVNVEFSNIFSKTNFVFDGKLNNATIISNFNYEKYPVKTQYYEEKSTTFDIVIFGIHFVIPEIKEEIPVETPYNEKYYETPSKNKTIIEKYQY